MRDLVGILAALGLVRLFWDGVMRWSAFYQRYRLDKRTPPEVPPLRR